jgi:hypothetical protein
MVNYLTTDEGRLHMAVDHAYQGSVNSYNNCITRFFTKLCKYSIDVTINGETHCLNKISYVKLLHKRGRADATVENLDTFKNFAAIAIPNVIINEGFMRQHLSADKVNELTKELIENLNKSNLPQAAQILGQGAEVNKYFWVREDISTIHYSEESVTRYLPIYDTQFRVGKYTPLLHASFKIKDAAFCQRLVNFGANQNTKGQFYTFNRRIIQILDHAPELQTTVTQDVRVRGGHGRRPARVVVRDRVHLDVVSKQTTQYQDSLVARWETQYGQQPFLLLDIVGPIQSETHETGRGRIGRVY